MHHHLTEKNQETKGEMKKGLMVKPQFLEHHSSYPTKRQS